MSGICLPPDLQHVDPMFNFSEVKSNKELTLSLHVDHAFRHAKELETATHGGYNQGFLDLPAGHGDLLVQLSTIPSSKSEQPLQPNLLHVTIMNEATRKALWKLKMEPRYWRLQLRIKGEQAFLLDADGVEIEDSKVNPMNIVHVTESGQRRLMFGENGLLMTIITPLQSVNRSSGIRITDVFQDRLENDDRASRVKQPASKLVAAFTDKKVNKYAKIELHRCRIRADVFDPLTGELLGEAVSGDINNTKNNDVGAINLLEMSDPRCSCTEGGFKVLLSSEFRAPTLKGKEPPVRVLFVVERNGMVHQAQEIYQDFKQITLENFQIYQNSTLAFIVPAQNVNCIRRMQRANDTLKLALYRPHDGMFSARKFRFDYYEHQTGDCHFCAIMGRVGADEANVKQLEKKKRARKDERVRRTVQKNNGDHNGSGVFSPPSSSGISSQEEFSPANKMQRMSDSEASPEMMQHPVEQQFQVQQPITVEDLPLAVTTAYPEFTLGGHDTFTDILQEPIQQNNLTTLAPMSVPQVDATMMYNTQDINSLIESVTGDVANNAPVVDNHQPMFQGFNGTVPDCKNDRKNSSDRQVFGGFDGLILSDSCSTSHNEEDFLGVPDGCQSPKKVGCCEAVSKEEDPEKLCEGFQKLDLVDEEIQKEVNVISSKPSQEDKSTDMEGLCHEMESVGFIGKKKKGFFKSLAKKLGL